MTTIATLKTQTQPQGLRSFNIKKDLNRVADLIELCFQSHLDPDGQRYLRQMRVTARQIRSHRWSMLRSTRLSIPVSGYVWEVDGEIVGNLSLVPIKNFSNHIYLIANVAVHPDFRKRGIARALTKAGVQKVQRMRGQIIWLQVRADNPPAIHLYRSMDFNEICRRTTWELLPQQYHRHREDSLELAGFHIEKYQRHHWEQHKEWLRAAYPRRLRWQIQVNETHLKPGFFPSIRRLFDEVSIYQCSVINQGRLVGVITWQKSYGYADHVWIAADPDYETQTIKTGLDHLIQRRKIRRKVVIDHPEGKNAATLAELGFKDKFTLIWMRQQIR